MSIYILLGGPSAPQSWVRPPQWCALPPPPNIATSLSPFKQVLSHSKEDTWTVAESEASVPNYFKVYVFIAVDRKISIRVTTGGLNLVIILSRELLLLFLYSWVLSNHQWTTNRSRNWIYPCFAEILKTGKRSSEKFGRLWFWLDIECHGGYRQNVLALTHTSQTWQFW